MYMEIFNILFTLVGNAVRFYGVSYFVACFADEKKWDGKKLFFLYVLGWAATSLTGVCFTYPLLNMASNIAAFFLIVSAYSMDKGRKYMALAVTYVMGVFVEAFVFLAFARYVPGQHVGFVWQGLVALIFLSMGMFLRGKFKDKRDISLPARAMAVFLAIPLLTQAYIVYLLVFRQEMGALSVFTSLMLFLLNLFALYFYYCLLELYSVCQGKGLSAQMKRVLTYQSKVDEGSKRRLRELRHDMKYHLRELSAMAAKGKRKELLDYIDSMNKFMLNKEEYVCTGNEELDGLLNYMLKEADRLLGGAQVEIKIPDKIYFGDFAMCVILGNLVDNALREAAKSEEKLLSVKMEINKGILVIEVENSYAGEIIENEDGLQTNQEDMDIHGIGLKSVRRVVEEVGGKMTVDHANHRFWVQVLLYGFEERN